MLGMGLSAPCSRSELIREALRAYLEMCQVRKLRLRQVAERPALYGDYAAEFEAWDAASDEALLNFEKGLD
jgi:Arc/MetJ-type ribon-helix-helix transcriptional regulator